MSDDNSLKKNDSDVEGTAGKVKHFKIETEDVFGEEDSGVDPVYQAKARILNDALQEIGMGKYQVSSVMR